MKKKEKKKKLLTFDEREVQSIYIHVKLWNKNKTSEKKEEK